jgi:hypothetical protein
VPHGNFPNMGANRIEKFFRHYDLHCRGRAGRRNGKGDSGRVVASLDRKRLGQGVGSEVGSRSEVFSIKETRRKPPAFATDAA